jgi:hypothetical protein
MAHLLSMRPEGVESKNAIGARKTACSMLSKNAFAVVSPEKAINVDLKVRMLIRQVKKIRVWLSQVGGSKIE